VNPRAGHRPLPWHENPYRLFSWWDMHNFASQELLMLGMWLENVKRRVDAVSRRPLLPEEQDLILNNLEIVERILSSIGLGHSERMLSEMEADVRRAIGTDALSSNIRHLQKDIQVELERNLFMYIPPDRAKWYHSPRNGWEQVIRRFPKTATEIEECSKCYACDRFGAAVFHIMLVAEAGAVELGKVIGVTSHRPGFGSTVKAGKKILNKDANALSVEESKYKPLLEMTVRRQ
jgi:hypothetical protein